MFTKGPGDLWEPDWVYQDEPEPEDDEDDRDWQSLLDTIPDDDCGNVAAERAA